MKIYTGKNTYQHGFESNAQRYLSRKEAYKILQPFLKLRVVQQAHWATSCSEVVQYGRRARHSFYLEGPPEICEQIRSMVERRR